MSVTARASAIPSEVVGRRGRAWRAAAVLALLALAAICPVAVVRAAVPGPRAAADDSTTPSELWKQFPLGQPRRDIGPGAGGSTAPGPQGAGGGRTVAGGSPGPSPSDSGSGFNWLWLLLLVPVAALAALFVAGARKQRQPAWAGPDPRAGRQRRRDPPYRELIERSEPPSWLRERDPAEGGPRYELTEPVPPLSPRHPRRQPAYSPAQASPPWPGESPQPAPTPPRAAPTPPPRPAPGPPRAGPARPPQPQPVARRAAPTPPPHPAPGPPGAAPMRPPQGEPVVRRAVPPPPGPPRSAPTRRPQPAPTAQRAVPGATPPPRPAPAPPRSSPTPSPASAPQARREAAPGQPFPAGRRDWEPPRPPTPTAPWRRGDSARGKRSDAAAAESALPPAPPPPPAAEPADSWLMHDQPDAAQTESAVPGSRRPLPEVTNAPAAPPETDERPEAFAPPIAPGTEKSEARPATPSPGPEMGEQARVTIEWQAIDPDAPAPQPPTQAEDGSGRRFGREGVEDRAEEDGREEESAHSRPRHPALPPKRVGRPRSPRTLWRRATGRDSR
jgi:hypothetical protein